MVSASIVAVDWGDEFAGQKVPDDRAVQAGQNGIAIAGCRRTTVFRTDEPAELATTDGEAGAALAPGGIAFADFPAGNGVHRMPTIQRQQEQKLNHHAHGHVPPALLITLHSLFGDSKRIGQLGLISPQDAPDAPHRL